MAKKKKMAYGFFTPWEFLVKKGSELGIVAKEPNNLDSERNVVLQTLHRLIRDAGLDYPQRAQQVLIFTDRDHILFDHGIALATNDPSYGLPRDPPPRDVIDKMKRVLGVSEDPKWFYINTSFD